MTFNDATRRLASRRQFDRQQRRGAGKAIAQRHAKGWETGGLMMYPNTVQHAKRPFGKKKIQSSAMSSGWYKSCQRCLQA